jgi:hypothetical protein
MCCIAHAAIVRVALLLDHPAIVVDPGGAEKARDIEHVRKAIDADRKVPLEFVGEILRQIGIGALIVAVHRDGAPLGAVRPVRGGRVALVTHRV